MATYGPGRDRCMQGIVASPFSGKSKVGEEIHGDSGKNGVRAGKLRQGNTSWFEDCVEDHDIQTITDVKGGLLIRESGHTYPFWINDVPRAGIGNDQRKGKRNPSHVWTGQMAASGKPAPRLTTLRSPTALSVVSRYHSALPEVKRRNLNKPTGGSIWGDQGGSFFS